MPGSYSVRLVALTLDCDAKWIDNLLSHHPLPGVERQQRGMERRLSYDAVVIIEATRMLTVDLGLPLSRALAIATRVLSSTDASRQILTTSGIAISLPLAAIEARVRGRLIDAVEGVAHIQRGRPRRVSE